MKLRKMLKSDWLIARAVLTVVGLSIAGCSINTEKGNRELFTRIRPEESGINFRNDLAFDKSFNIFTYRNFYNGGGVGIGDINKDGLPDIYFTSNLGDNKLYLNKGNFTFEDVTERAGVKGSRAWSTGVSIADVNGDGWPDIYVCNSGDIKGDNKQNELFINNGDLTFTEQAEAYGLADQGFSTHAVFFDYDNDGDLDVYLLNNSYQAIGSFNLMQNIRQVRDSVGGDKLYRNDGNTFTDVSEQAGIYGSVIGFGLGVTVGDVNNDGWMDIFVSNDFFERDYLYINNQDGTFREELEKCMPSISAASMGADMADIDDDGWMDIFVTDMLPEDDYRLKQITTFENWDKFTYNFKNGYHYQLTRNMLHKNNGDGTFSEIGRLAGVEATDWSWAALIFDMDNDGMKDIFVANGIYQDITDLDYLSFIADEKTVKKIISQEGVDYESLIRPIPVNPVANYAFRNLGGLRFANMAKLWGLGEVVHSNGSAYADLDNDGDLDLVINNVNEEAFVYRNNGRGGDGNYLKIRLEGEGKNTQAIGARIEARISGKVHVAEQMPNRGFQSSVDPIIHIGLGPDAQVDELLIRWPDHRVTRLIDVPINQTLTAKQIEAASSSSTFRGNGNSFFTEITDLSVLPFVHQENTFVDFDRDRLTYHMLSTQGPSIAVSDVNADGLMDVYIGGAREQAGSLFIQQQSGKFLLKQNKAFEEDRRSEDVGSVFFDFDGDGDQDLFVASGGNEFSVGAPELIDRLYLNDGKGNFTRSTQAALSGNIYVSGKVKVADINGDGKPDVVVANRAQPFVYGAPAGIRIYFNDGVVLRDATREIAPDAMDIGMVSDVSLADLDGDGDKDIVLVGEWMAPQVLLNEQGRFSKVSKSGVENVSGWWNVIQPADIDGDGDIDFVVGNHGLNSRFKVTRDSPLYLYVNDFDGNGAIEHIYARTIDKKVYPYTLKHDLVMQMPGLKKKYLKYESYNKQTVSEIFTKEQLQSGITLSANEMQTGVLINEGNATFTFRPLPVEAQFSPVFGVLINDINNDSKSDIILGGNLFEAKPEAGRYDASYGVVLLGDGKGNFRAVPQWESGLTIKGAVRDIKLVTLNNQDVLLVSCNNDRVKLYSIK